MKTSEARTPIRWGSVFILALGGAAVFMIPYTRIIYYDPLMKALGATNTQLGLLSSFFGLLTLICYFPGGWLADRFSAKKLLVISFLANGGLGFWYAAMPGFGTVVFIHVLLGLFCSLTFWAAYVKATRRCAPPGAAGPGVWRGGGSPAADVGDHRFDRVVYSIPLPG